MQKTKFTIPPLTRVFPAAASLVVAVSIPTSVMASTLDARMELGVSGSQVVGLDDGFGAEVGYFRYAQFAH